MRGGTRLDVAVQDLERVKVLQPAQRLGVETPDVGLGEEDTTPRLHEHKGYIDVTSTGEGKRV